MKIGGLWETIGPLLAKREGQGWVYGLQTSGRHANPVGLVHGGTLMALLDHTMTLVAYALNDKTPALTVQMENRFLNAARPGDLLVGQAVLTHRTGSMLFLDATLHVGDRLIADATAIMKAKPDA